MDRGIPGLDQLRLELRSALEAELVHAEQLLWVGQPRPDVRTLAGRIMSSFWAMVGLKVLCIGPIVLGLRGIGDAIDLWVPGATRPLIIQLVSFGILTLIGAGFLCMFWSFHVHRGEDLANIVFAATSERILGFQHGLDDSTWNMLYPDLEIQAINVQSDGTGDVCFHRPSDPAAPEVEHSLVTGIDYATFQRIPDAEQVAAILRHACDTPYATHA
jgi:hypothetical protein